MATSGVFQQGGRDARRQDRRRRAQGKSRRPHVRTPTWLESGGQSWQILSEASEKASRGVPDELAAFCRGNGFDQCADVIASRHGVRKLRPGVDGTLHPLVHGEQPVQLLAGVVEPAPHDVPHKLAGTRSEEHTSELQSLMRTPYAVFCFKKN